MATDGVRAIIFDIGRVLVRLDLARAQHALTDGSRLSPQELWPAIEKHPQWKDWQEGRIAARDWHLNLCSRLGVKLSFEEFVSAWNSVMDPQPIHPDSLFASLSKKYRLGLLSNTDPIHVPYLESTYSFYRYFPKSTRIYSCAVGACKPDPLVFREALKACRVKAEEAIYLDDIAEFAQTARALGMKGMHFVTAEQMRRDLSGLGIEVE